MRGRLYKRYDDVQGIGIVAQILIWNMDERAEF